MGPNGAVIALEVVRTLATAGTLPGVLRQRLAGAALVAGLSAAEVAPLLSDGPHLCRVACEVAGRHLRATANVHTARPDWR